MSANMERKMFASREKNPWWSAKDENYVYQDVTDLELFDLAGLSWQVVSESVYDDNGFEHPEYVMHRHSETGDILNLTKGVYTDIQNIDFAKQIFPIGNLTDCGAIGKGEKVFFNFASDDFAIGEGNTHKTYIVAALPHDGKMKITLGVSTFRVECQNTFTAWKKSLKDTDFLAVKQTDTATHKIDAWVKAFLAVQEENKTMHQIFLELARRKFNPDTQASVISKIFAEKTSTRTTNIMKRIAEIIGDNASNIPVAQKNTGYDLFNGFTYFTSHESVIKKTGDRLTSVMFGTGQKLAEKAFNIILETKPDEYVENLQRVISL